MKKTACVMLCVAVVFLTACSAATQFVSQASPAITEEFKEVTEIENTPPQTARVEKKKIILELEFGEYYGVYTGEMLDDLPHGDGSFEASNPDDYLIMYEGKWNSGHLNGRGKLYNTDFMYEGTFTNDMLDGRIDAFDAYGNHVYSCVYEKGKIVDYMYDYNFSKLNDFAKECEYIDYYAFFKDPDAHAGKKIIINGRILDASYDEMMYCHLLVAMEDEDYFMLAVKVLNLDNKDEIIKTGYITLTILMDGTLYNHMETHDELSEYGVDKA